MAYILDDAYNIVQNTLGSLAGEHESNTYKPKAYKGKLKAYTIDNQYGDTLGGALANSSNRSTPVARAAIARDVNIDQTGQAQFRQGQSALGQQLQARAAGTAPSAAEMQMGRGLDSAIAAQRSAAASARGVSPGMAQRLAAQGTAQAQGQVMADTAQLRAQEQAQAEQALGQHLANARSQDIGLATSQAGVTQQTNLANAGFRQQAAQGNQQAELTNRAQMDQATQAYLSMGMSREQAEQQALADREEAYQQNRLGVQQIKSGIASSNTQAANQAQGGAISALGAVASAYAKSDKRAKEDIRDGRAASKEFLDGLKAYTFKYKDSSDGEGKHLGVMAQDIEKLPGGRGMVIESADGAKMLHAGQGVGRLLAAAAELNRRVNKLEARR